MTNRTLYREHDESNETSGLLLSAAERNCCVARLRGDRRNFVNVQGVERGEQNGGTWPSKCSDVFLL